MTKHEIDYIYKYIKTLIQEPIDNSNPVLVRDKLSNLCNYSATVAMAKAKADELLIDAMAEAVLSNKDTSLGAQEKKALYAKECKEENMLVLKGEYLLKECHYSIEALRSVLSYTKEEMRNMPYGA